MDYNSLLAQSLMNMSQQPQANTQGGAIANSLGGVNGVLMNYMLARKALGMPQQQPAPITQAQSAPPPIPQQPPVPMPPPQQPPVMGGAMPMQ